MKKQTPLFGQWIGQFTGAATTPGSSEYVFPGYATFNIERDFPDKAFACIDQGNKIHGSRKDFAIKIEGAQISGRAVSTTAFDYEKNESITIEESIKRQKVLGRDIFYLTDLEIHNGYIDERSLKCEWFGTHQGNKITGRYDAIKLGQWKPSPADKLMTWQEFKTFIAGEIQTGQESFFRGQASNKFRLNTSFHREYRYDLIRYDREACVLLEQHINAACSRQFDRNIPNDYGALLCLAQHHGFPTPLLDWSKSPYIAAFFAFESRPVSLGESDNPRLYIFNAMKWVRETTQAGSIVDPRPVIVPREFPVHNNPRHMPQQSVHTYTNLEDPEEWIRLTEKQLGQKYLTVIEIPRSERHLVMRDLAYMGVTAAALFPGLDGICRSLKERFFRLHQ